VKAHRFAHILLRESLQMNRRENLKESIVQDLRILKPRLAANA
jgi:hypothetical protein